MILAFLVCIVFLFLFGVSFGRNIAEPEQVFDTRQLLHKLSSFLAGVEEGAIV
jgi:hypothetical protein